MEWGGIPVSARAATFAYEPLKLKAEDLNGNTVFGLNESYQGLAANESKVKLDNGAAFYAESEERSSNFFAGIDGGPGDATDPAGLPVNGKVTVEGVPFQLACGADPQKAYDGNDSIHLKAVQNDEIRYLTHTVGLDTIGVYDELYLLAIAAGPGEPSFVNFDVVLTYTDGHTSETKFKVHDWYDDLSDLVRCNDFARVACTDDKPTFHIQEVGSDGPPFLFSYHVDADETRLLKSITLSIVGKDDQTGDEWYNENGIFCGIYAITGSVDQDAPNSPRATDATGIDASSFTANWDGVFNATGYRLDVSADPDFKTFLPGWDNVDVGNATSYRVTGVDDSMICYYRVRAVNSKGQSLSSNVISVGESARRIVDLPQTGDSAQPLLWLTLCTVSVLCLAGVRARRKAC